MGDEEMSKKETLKTLDELNASLPAKKEEKPLPTLDELNGGEKKKPETLPLQKQSASPLVTEDGTSGSETGASGQQNIPKINESLNPPGVLTEDHSEEPKITVPSQQNPVTSFEWNPVEAEKKFNATQPTVRTALGNKIPVSPADAMQPVSNSGGDMQALAIQDKVNKDQEHKNLVDAYDKNDGDNKNVDQAYMEHLKETNPDEYKFTLDKYSELSKKEDKLDLEKFQAEQMSKAMEFKTKVYSGKYQIAKNVIDDNYKDKVDAFNSAGEQANSVSKEVQKIDEQLKQFPVNSKGEIVSDASNAKQIQGLLDGRNQLIDQIKTNIAKQETISNDPGYKEATSIMDDVSSKYDKLSQTYYNIATKNPEAFRALPEYKKYIEGKKSSQEDVDLSAGEDEATAREIGRAVGNTVTNFVSKLAYIPKAFTDNNKYGWTDKLYEGTRDMVDDFNQEYLPQPSAYNKPIVQDGKWNLKYLPAKIAGTVTDMGLMAVGGMGAGVLTKIGLSASTASSLGAFTSGYVMSAAGYYEDARQAGMSDKEATSFSRGLAAQQALLELISPNEKLITPGKLKSNFDDYAKMVGRGATKIEAGKEFLKKTATDIGKEVGQENLQQLDEIANKRAANEMSGVNNEVKQSTADQMAETTVLTILSTFGLSGAGSFKSQSRMNQEALYMAAHAPEKLMPTLDKLVDAKVLSETQASQVMQKVNKASSRLLSLPETMSDEEKISAINTPDALSVAREKGDYQKAQSLADQKESLGKELANPLIAPETKAILQETLVSVEKQDMALSKELADKHDKLPENKKAEVNEILKKVDKLHKAALDRNISPEAKENLSIQIAELDKEKTEIYKENEKILKEREKELAKDEEFDFDSEENKKHEEELIKKFVPPVVEEAVKPEIKKELVPPTPEKVVADVATEKPVADVSVNEPKTETNVKETEKEKEAVLETAKPEEKTPSSPKETTGAGNATVSKGKINNTVFDVPVSEVSTDEGRFQKRETKVAKATVDKFEEEGYLEHKMMPILLWKDPKDGKTYVLSGHSRLQAHKNLGRENIQAKYFTGTEEQALEAAETSNSDATLQSDVENASRYRGKRLKGESYNSVYKDAQKNEKSNAARIMSFSYLNPKGKVMDALRSLIGKDVESERKIMTAANWIGDVRRHHEELTDEHENELYDYLINKGYLNKIKSKVEFNNRISKVADAVRMNPDKPLNLEHKVTRGALETEAIEAYDNLDKQIKDLEKERKTASVERAKEINIQRDFLTEKLGKANEAIKKAREADNDQVDLFAQVDEVITNNEITDGNAEEFIGNTKEVAKSEPIIEAIESKEKVAETLSAEEVEREIEKVDKLIGEEKPSNDKLIDLDEQEDEAKKVSEAAIKKLEDNIEALKQSSFPQEKHDLLVSRIGRMVEDGEINKSTANQFKRIAREVLDGKKKEKFAKETNKKAEEFAKKITNPRNTKPGENDVTTNSVLPGVNKAVEHLINFGSKVIIAGHSAGMDINAAIDNAWNAIKEHAIYKKLLEKGKVNEKDFEKQFKEKFAQKEEPVAKEVVEKTIVKEDKKASAKKTHALAKTMINSIADEKLKEAVKKEGIYYNTKKVKATTENAKAVIKVAESAGELAELEDRVINDGTMDPLHRGMISLELAKMRSDEFNEMPYGREREAVEKRFAELYKVSEVKGTEGGQQGAIIGKRAKLLFKADPNLVIATIKEGLAEGIDKSLGKKSKKLEKSAKDIEEIFNKIERPSKEKLEHLKAKRNVLLTKLKDSFNAKPGVTKQTFSPLSDEQIKLLAQVAANYLETGVVHLESLVKKIKRDYKEATGFNLSNKDIDKVLAENHNPKQNIGEKVKELSEKRREEVRAAAKQASQLVKKSEANQVVDKVQKELDKLTEENQPNKYKVEPEKGDVDLAKKLLEEVINKDETLSPFAKERLLEDVMIHLEENGKMSAADFKTHYSNAVGVSKFGPEQEQAVREALKVIREADKIARAGSKKIAEYLEAKAAGDKTLTASLEKEIKEKLSQFLAAQRKAAQANQEVSKHFVEFNPFALIASNIQLNLLTTASQVNNIVSYWPEIPTRFAQNSLASIIDRVRVMIAMTAAGKKLGLNPNRNFSRLKELGYGYQYGFTNGLKKAGIGLIKGNADDSYTERNTHYQYNAPAKFIEAFNKLTDKQKKDWVGALKNVTEGVFTLAPDIASRLLAFGDLPVKERNRISAAIGIAQSEGKSGIEAIDLIFNPTDEQAEKITYEAEKSSFQNPNTASKAVDKTLGQAIASLEKKGGSAYVMGGVLRIIRATIIPFVKTPGNLIDLTLERMIAPYAITRAVLHAKNGNTREAEKSIANAAIGVAMASVALKMFAAGMLMPTSGDEDKKEKDIEYLTKKPDTINRDALLRLLSGQSDWDKARPTDTWVNYSKLGANGMFFGTMANHFDAMQTNGPDIKETNLLSDMLGATPMMMSVALNNSFLQQLNNINEAINDKTGEKQNKLYSTELGGLFAAVYPNTIAAASLSGQDLIKDRKTIKGFEDQLAFDFKQKLFSGDDLPNKIDIFGRPVNRAPAGENKYVYYMLNPLKSYEINTNTPEYKLFEFLNTIPKSEEGRLNVIPSQPKNEIDGKIISGKNYEEFQKNVGTYRYNMLNLYVNSADWHTDNSAAKQDYLKQIWKSGYQYGKEQFIENHPQFEKPEEESENDFEKKEVPEREEL